MSVVRAAPLILVVDDSPLERRVVVSVLERQGGLQIRTAANGREALRLIEAEPPAVVVTDMQMPEMDGLTLVEEVRRCCPAIPIILMTAHGSEDVAIQALQKGAASYVPKKSLHYELGGTIERVLLTSQVDRRRQRVLECIKELDCRMELENDPPLVPLLVTHFQEQLVRLGLCDERDKVRLGVALEEALLNAIYHGNLELSSMLREDGGDTYQRLAQQRCHCAPYADRRVHLRARLSRHEAIFVIRDEGPGFDVSRLPRPTDPENLLKLSGRGLLLIRTFMDEVRHNETGNEITMVRRRRDSRPG